DHIDDEITMMFGNTTSALGRALESSVSIDSYEKTLGKELAKAMATMERRVVSKELASTFTCEDMREGAFSQLIDESRLAISEDTLQEALDSFAMGTGISTVLVIDDMADVLDTYIPLGSWALFLCGVILIGITVWLIMRIIKAKHRSGQ
ncbi:MAG: hypothetical protein IJW46_00655, partial [Clostridia bacterium]|nr:hypothetical protein [Clostridia bacterium]